MYSNVLKIIAIYLNKSTRGGYLIRKVQINLSFWIFVNYRGHLWGGIWGETI